MFARDLFGDFRDHVEITNINTHKRKSCMYIITPELTANISPREHVFVSKTQTLIPAIIYEFTVFI